MKHLNLIMMLILALTIYSCDKEEDNGKSLTLDKVSGFVQKGPYLNGTAVTISELTSDLTPTGKNFTSQILDNKGTFEIKNVNLTSQYVEIKADGFYFNEVSNSNSTAQLTLYALSDLSDLSDKSSLNINALTNLEKNRVDYLVSNGMSFTEAKSQAQVEILSIFEISKNKILDSEQLDITKTGDDNAILLAVSVILQGHLSVSELSELLANISTDIREDGILNSQTLGSKLINNAKTIKLETIRTNLESRYEELGLNVTIPDFEKYVNQFIESTKFEFTGFIEYPETGKHGANILDKTKTEYTAGTYSMKAILPNGTKLMVKISGQNWYYPALQNNTAWESSDWNDTDNSRIFTATKTGDIDFEILFESFQYSTWSNITNIFVYENNDLEPTWSKKITVN